VSQYFEDLTDLSFFSGRLMIALDPVDKVDIQVLVDNLTTACPQFLHLWRLKSPD